MNLRHCLTAPVALLLALAAGGLHAQARTAPGEGPFKHVPRPTTAAISAADAMTRVYVLADDSMMGREAGTRGGAMGTDYIARELQRLGLEPAGDNGTYFQAIPLVRRGVDPASALTVGGAALTLWTDFVPLPALGGAFTYHPEFRSAGAPAVYGGRLGDANVISPEAAAGKFVVFSAPLGQNGQPTYQFWTQGSLARYQQAAGVAIAVLDLTPAGVVGFFRQEQYAMADPAARPLPAPPGFIVTSAVAERVLGAPLAGLAVGAAGAASVGGSSRFADQPTEAPARNVVAVLRGGDPRLRGEYVAIGSHNDHDGVSPQAVDHDSLLAFNRVLRPQGADQLPDSVTPDKAARFRAELDRLRALRQPRRDSVFNGADDDASGVVGMLEIAEAFVRAPQRPRRSVLFVWHTAEEKGLLGSRYYGDHPTVPRDAIVAQLNIDMIGRGKAGDLEGGGDAYLQLVGSRRLSTELGNLVEEVNRTKGSGFTFDYSMDADNHPQNIYCRSDHYNYARWGIPVTFFTTGGHSDYHMLTDEPQYIDFPKLARVSQFIHDVAEAIANRDARLVVDKPKPNPDGPCQQ
ncbi:MAG TPA: M20/M25/M40 family metallo-hydrolase [Longimicrobiaceae bacterium]|nr:M20/M25/M40 family metallo-hydrolase [Longimicrobiaceae bacterium]